MKSCVSAIQESGPDGKGVKSFPLGCKCLVMMGRLPTHALLRVLIQTIRSGPPDAEAFDCVWADLDDRSGMTSELATFAPASMSLQGFVQVLKRQFRPRAPRARIMLLRFDGWSRHNKETWRSCWCCSPYTSDIEKLNSEHAKWPSTTPVPWPWV